MAFRAAFKVARWRPRGSRRRSEPSTVIDVYRRGLFPMGIPELPGLLGWSRQSARNSAPRRSSRDAFDAAEREALRSSRGYLLHARDTRLRRSVAWGRLDQRRVRQAYTRLHELGWAHSIEVLDRSGQLAGGLYGVRIAGFFSGESMFHVERDASKVALMALVDLMRSSGMTLLDVQWCSEHLASLGAIAISRREYLSRLAHAVATRSRSMPGIAERRSIVVRNLVVCAICLASLRARHGAGRKNRYRQRAEGIGRCEIHHVFGIGEGCGIPAVRSQRRRDDLPGDP